MEARAHRLAFLCVAALAAAALAAAVVANLDADSRLERVNAAIRSAARRSNE